MGNPGELIGHSPSPVADTRIHVFPADGTGLAPLAFGKQRLATGRMHARRSTRPGEVDHEDIESDRDPRTDRGRMRRSHGIGN